MEYTTQEIEAKVAEIKKAKASLNAQFAKSNPQEAKAIEEAKSFKKVLEDCKNTLNWEDWGLMRPIISHAEEFLFTVKLESAGIKTRLEN